MGKKGQKVEAPDFGPLIDILKESSDWSYKLAQEQFDWAKKTYNDNKATGDQVIDFALGEMDKRSAWADADRKRYEDIYQPMEAEAAQRAHEYSTKERQELAAGEAESQVADEMDRAKKAAQDRLEQFGVDPSQTRSAALDLGMNMAGATAQAQAGNAARRQTEMYGDQLMANAINTGKGYPAQVLGAAGSASASGNQAFNTGVAGAQSGANTMGTPGSWQQIGNQGLGMAGQMMQAQNQADINTLGANQQASSGFGTALGIASQYLPMFAAEGGAIPESMGYPSMGVPVPPEASPSQGIETDDVDATMPDGGPAQLNAGEFIVPKDVVAWLGEKGLQQIILKARKEMGDPGKAPAQPEVGPPGAQGPPGMPPQTPPRGVGAIPELEGMA